jgi:cyclopropane fatty-acyl-phospholipid synthase-like methyltransferase
MSPPLESTFYAYGEVSDGVLAEIRRETYGEDLGQFSWITADELRKFFNRLQLTADSHVLDVACGSGGPALFTAQTVGCSVIGIDINQAGIVAVQRMAEARGLQDRVRFQQVDAGGVLPFEDVTFDAIISIDAMNHFANRNELLREWRRVLRPGGRFLFTDATIITGTLSRDEIFARSSSMGHFLFTPRGSHEELIQNAGFVELEVEDVTDTIAMVSKRWHDARERRSSQLLEIETSSEFENLQRMLSAAHSLASEHRLSRFAYLSRKPTSG